MCKMFTSSTFSEHYFFSSYLQPSGGPMIYIEYFLMLGSGVYRSWCVNFMFQLVLISPPSRSLVFCFSINAVDNTITMIELLYQFFFYQLSVYKHFFFISGCILFVCLCRTRKYYLFFIQIYHCYIPIVFFSLNVMNIIFSGLVFFFLSFNFLEFKLNLICIELCCIFFSICLCVCIFVCVFF